MNSSFVKMTAVFVGFVSFFTGTMSVILAAFSFDVSGVIGLPGFMAVLISVSVGVASIIVFSVSSKRERAARAEALKRANEISVLERKIVEARQREDENAELARELFKVFIHTLSAPWEGHKHSDAFFKTQRTLRKHLRVASDNSDRFDGAVEQIRVELDRLRLTLVDANAPVLELRDAELLLKTIDNFRERNSS